MASRDNLRSIPLVKISSESEEDGEIEIEALSNNDTDNNEADSESSKEDDSLDIKPPQAALKSSDRRRDDRKRSHHSRKHESSSKSRDHRRIHDRNSGTSSRDIRPTAHSSDQNKGSTTHSSDSKKQSTTHTRGASKTENRDSKTRTVKSLVDSSRFKSNQSKDTERLQITRDYRKNPSDSSSSSHDVRDNRSKRDPRESRDRPVEVKREEKRKDMLEECRLKRLLYMERKREQEVPPAKTSSNSDNKQSGSRDLREKLQEKEKERKRREDKEKPERYRTPKEETAIEEKDKTPEPEVESMEFGEDKEFIIEEEDGDSDQNSDEKDDTASETESSGSDTEGSSNEGEENDGEEMSESAEDEETSAATNQPPTVEPEKKAPSPPKEEKENLPLYLPAIMGCRSVEEFDCLNKIEEGTYGVVYRAKDKRLGEIVALKRLKMEREKEGFPITSLREISTLLKAQHENIVKVREIVVGSNMDKIYIVMDYVEHDLKSLMETMKQPFLIGEVKTLMMQLLQAVAHLHDNWIIHRDLKTSNLLLSHKGILKVGDFGLAREYGSPLKQYTPIVVTLWYRAPELLLGAKQYSCPIDIWSVGCIFGELLTMKPLFPGKSEIDQLEKIFKDLGTPREKIWPGYNDLPLVKKVSFREHPFNNLRSRFSANLTEKGSHLINKFLTYYPKERITAESALSHEFFEEKPKPVSPDMFPTWPAKSEQGHRKKQSSPKPPSGGKQYAKQMGEGDDGLMAAAGFHMAGAQEGHSAKGPGFSLKF